MNASSNLVSVIIPAYNAEDLIRRALDSALNQTWPDLEVIIVDDGSTDRTAEICGSYGEKIRYIAQENKGVSSARNRGLAICTGEYVVFLDADDEIEPEMVECLMDDLADHPEVGVATAARWNIFPDGRKIVSPDPNVFQVEGVADYLEVCRTGPNICCMGSALYRKPVMDRAGGFKTWLKQSEDTEFFLRVSLVTTWYIERKPLMKRYLDNPASATFNKHGNRRVLEAFQPRFLARFRGGRAHVSRLFCAMFLRKKYKRMAADASRYRQYRRFMHSFYINLARHEIRQKSSRGFAGTALSYACATGCSFRLLKWTGIWLLSCVGLNPHR